LLTVDQVLEWLPADTETVFVARGPYRLKVHELKETEGPRAQSLEETLQDLAGGLSGRVNAGWKELAGETIDLAVEGARRFRGPRNLGLGPYDGCNILLFRHPLGKRATTLMKALEKEGKPAEIAGHTAVTWQEKHEGDTWTFFVVHPKPNVLLFATDRKYVEEVLQRMQNQGGKRALAPDLAEWKQVDTKARFWAVRHYDKAHAATDPTSPLAGRKMPANSPDAKAVGLTFSYDPGPGKPARVRYLSANESAIQIVKSRWTVPGEALDPDVKLLAKGVVEITIDLKTPRSQQIFVLLLLAGLGHAVYL
jgi:hypothetical protein